MMVRIEFIDEWIDFESIVNNGAFMYFPFSLGETWTNFIAYLRNSQLGTCCTNVNQKVRVTSCQTDYSRFSSIVSVSRCDLLSRQNHSFFRAQGTIFWLLSDEGEMVIPDIR